MDIGGCILDNIYSLLESAYDSVTEDEAIAGIVEMTPFGVAFSDMRSQVHECRDGSASDKIGVLAELWCVRLENLLFEARGKASHELLAKPDGKFSLTASLWAKGTAPLHNAIEYVRRAIVQRMAPYTPEVVEDA